MATMLYDVIILYRAKDKVRKVLKKDLTRHLDRECPNRNHMCEYCGKTGKYEFITRSHDFTCPEKMISCANTGCRYTLQRQGMKRHLDKCFHTMIPCKYIKLGCQMKGKRKDMVVHEDDSKCHLRMALDSVLKLHQENTDLKGKVSRLESCSQPTFKLTEYSKKRQFNEVFVSPSFYTSSPAGYHMSISVLANGDDSECDQKSYLSVSINIKRGENDEWLEWPFVGYVTITLLNQLVETRNLGHFKRTLHFDGVDSIEAGCTHLCRHFIRHDDLETHYLKDDTLYFTVSTDITNPKA
ncbi:MAG: hypothetical protein A6F71_04965 [Cycloclasticus sp. symbiont of Poecilosclerida sp. M]|nr:MAG: hypothetical protein A6F71_04965 [Cycloclasticus sp. symbiont of Poecilosclerida sp. M]